MSSDENKIVLSDLFVRKIIEHAFEDIQQMLMRVRKFPLQYDYQRLQRVLIDVDQTITRCFSLCLDRNRKGIHKRDLFFFDFEKDLTHRFFDPYNQDYHEGNFCGNIIRRGETSFICETCSENSKLIVYCADCFLRGEHRNHRYKNNNSVNAYCSCGADSSGEQQKYFCEAHKKTIGTDKPLKSSNLVEYKAQLKRLIWYFAYSFWKLCEDFKDNGWKLPTSTENDVRNSAIKKISLTILRRAFDCFESLLYVSCKHSEYILESVVDTMISNTHPLTHWDQKRQKYCFMKSGILDIIMRNGHVFASLKNFRIFHILSIVSPKFASLWSKVIFENKERLLLRSILHTSITISPLNYGLFMGAGILTLSFLQNPSELVSFLTNAIREKDLKEKLSNHFQDFYFTLEQIYRSCFENRSIARSIIESDSLEKLVLCMINNNQTVNDKAFSLSGENFLNNLQVYEHMAFFISNVETLIQSMLQFYNVEKRSAVVDRILNVLVRENDPSKGNSTNHVFTFRFFTMMIIAKFYLTSEETDPEEIKTYLMRDVFAGSEEKFARFVEIGLNQFLLFYTFFRKIFGCHETRHYLSFKLFAIDLFGLQTFITLAQKPEHSFPKMHESFRKIVKQTYPSNNVMNIETDLVIFRQEFMHLLLTVLECNLGNEFWKGLLTSQGKAQNAEAYRSFISTIVVVFQSEESSELLTRIRLVFPFLDNISLKKEILNFCTPLQKQGRYYMKPNKELFKYMNPSIFRHLLQGKFESLIEILTVANERNEFNYFFHDNLLPMTKLKKKLFECIIKAGLMQFLYQERHFSNQNLNGSDVVTGEAERLFLFLRLMVLSLLSRAHLENLAMNEASFEKLFGELKKSVEQRYAEFLFSIGLTQALKSIGSLASTLFPKVSLESASLKQVLQIRPSFTSLIVKQSITQQRSRSETGSQEIFINQIINQNVDHCPLIHINKEGILGNCVLINLVSTDVNSILERNLIESFFGNVTSDMKTEYLQRVKSSFHPIKSSRKYHIKCFLNFRSKDTRYLDNAGVEYTLLKHTAFALKEGLIDVLPNLYSEFIPFNHNLSDIVKHFVSELGKPTTAAHTIVRKETREGTQGQKFSDMTSYKYIERILGREIFNYINDYGVVDLGNRDLFYDLFDHLKHLLFSEVKMASLYGLREFYKWRVSAVKFTLAFFRKIYFRKRVSLQFLIVKFNLLSKLSHKLEELTEATLSSAVTKKIELLLIELSLVFLFLCENQSVIIPFLQLLYQHALVIKLVQIRTYIRLKNLKGEDEESIRFLRYLRSITALSLVFLNFHPGLASRFIVEDLDVSDEKMRLLVLLGLSEFNNFDSVLSKKFNFLNEELTRILSFGPDTNLFFLDMNILPLKIPSIFIQLPDVLLQFRILQSDCLCDLCRTCYDIEGEIIICLLCGVRMCYPLCYSDKEKNEIASHTIQTHGGQSIYIGRGSARAFLSYFEHMIPDGVLYKDVFGDSDFVTDNPNFSLYHLDRYYFKQLETMIVFNSTYEVIDERSHSKKKKKREPDFLQRRDVINFNMGLQI